MQQPQSRPLLGDSVSSSTSPTTHRNNPVAVLTQQQLQQLQQLQSQTSGAQALTFTLQQPSSNNQDHTNGSAAANHILYLNHLNQLNQGSINPNGTGMGLQSATPTFGVGLNMGLPLSLLNTSLSSLTSNAITTSNPLLNLSLPGINSGLSAINPSINQLSALGNLNSNLPSDSISSGLSNIQQDLTNMGAGINRLNALNATSINSGLSNINAGLASVNPNLTSLNTNTINQNLATINANLSVPNSSASSLNTLNSSLNLQHNSLSSALNQQGLNRPMNAIANFNPTSSGAQFPFQTIQSIQSIAPHIVGSSIANVVSSAISQNQVNTITSTAHSSSSGSSSSVSSTFTSSGSIFATNNTAQGTNTNQQVNVAQFGLMNPNLPSVVSSQVGPNESNLNVTSAGLQRHFTHQNLNQTSGTNQSITNIKTMQNIQNHNSASPGSPFSIPMKSPASNIAPPTPSPSPNRLLLRSPAPNTISSRNSPSPVSSATTNTNFGVQLQSPMQSPISVGQIQSPVPSPYPPSKSPHPTGPPLNTKSPVPGGSPGPPIVRPSTPILQQGMQVLQIIHNAQGYQQSPQIVTRTHLFGNQQIQIATKPNKQPPQILPKPPLQQTNVVQQKQRATTTITNQVTQQSQPQIVLASPQPNTPTATMIPTHQGLLLNQVLPSSGPVIVQQQPGGVQLILRTPANAQQQTHTAQLTQQQLVRVVTAQGMQIQGLTPTFFAVPNGFSSPAPPVIRHTPSSPAPANTNNNGSIVIQNSVVPNSQPQMAQTPTINPSPNTTQNAQTVIDQSLLPPPKKKAKKKKKTKKREEEPPKMDLANIMKISGIGDDDDIFDNDLTPENEAPPQVESSPAQNPPAASIPNTTAQPAQQNIVPAPSSSNTLHSIPQDELSSPQLPMQAPTPVQNAPAISGQLRLAVGEDGRVVLHHTPDPNQPEIDQATMQALIRSLTQGNGPNSQIISQLLQAQIQSSQSLTSNQLKPVRSVPVSASPLNSQVPTPAMSPQQVSVSSNQSSLQNVHVSGVPQNSPTVVATTMQTSNVQSSVNVNPSNLGQQPKSVVITRKIFDAKKQTVVEVKTAPGVKTSVVGNRTVVLSQQTKSNQTKLKNSTINTTQQHNVIKQVVSQVQKPAQVYTTAPRNVQQVKNIQNQIHQIGIQEDSTLIPQNSSLYQQNVAQQVSTSQTFQSQNIQHFYEQNLHQNIGPTLQRTIDGIKVEPNIAVPLSNSTNNAQQIHQQSLNFMQQNIGSNVPSHDQSIQLTNDTQLGSQQNLHANSSHIRSQKPVNASLETNHLTDAQNHQPNLLISNAPCQMQQQEVKEEPQKQCNIESPAASILNNAPKITPEILSALSNLNPNDQLLIANANGQMQVISQQLLQQFLAGQFNAQAQAQSQSQPQAQNQTQHQNQTQKIVIGEADSNNSNMQEVQINTPTSQIIVNSSGGAPTIQNNIQNIVVQAAPTQMPQQIQIQNSGFPSQFIDNLNQQQIRNLSNTNQNANPTVNHSAPAPKKAKVVKKKVVTVAQPGKAVTISRSLVMNSGTTSSTSVTTCTSSLSTKTQETSIKAANLTPVADSNKHDPASATPVNGPITSLSSNQMPVLSTGQVVQRVQTIQLSSQKQQMLTSNQAQIRSIQGRKTISAADQAVLTKLYQEQARILASGKIISTSHPIHTETSDAMINVNVVSSTTMTSNNVAQTSCKTQMSTAQTQTPASTLSPSMSMNTQSIHLATSSPSNMYMPSLMTQQISSTASLKQMPSLPAQHSQQQTQTQTNESQVLAPPCSNPKGFGSSPKPALEAQHSTCQNDLGVLDSIKTCSQATSPIVCKSELVSPVPLQTLSAPSAGQMNVACGKALLSNSQTKLLSPDHNNVSTSPRQGVKRASTSSPIRQISRGDLFEQQLIIDQNGVTNPDCNTPFQSKSDACERLVRYHCLNDPVLSSKDLEKADEIFEETAKHLLSKFDSMVNKYAYLLIMESMRETRTSELMMIDRMIVNEEQVALNRLREQEAKSAADEMKAKPKVEVDSEPEIKLENELEGQRLLIPKIESDVADLAAAAAASVKLEVDLEVKSADYDEWLEIQKELGVFTPSELALSKCRHKSSRTTRANGESRDPSGIECASELERDLLEDTESLDGLALYAQTQCPTRSQSSDLRSDEHDDITAQVQSAIDSILSLKKRPSSSTNATSSQASSSDNSSEKLLDQAVRSILGS